MREIVGRQNMKKSNTRRRARYSKRRREKNGVSRYLGTTNDIIYPEEDGAQSNVVERATDPH